MDADIWVSNRKLLQTPNCRYSCNADYNEAMNMLKRLWLHTYGGAELIVPRTWWDEAIRLANREFPTLVVGTSKQ